MKAKREELRIGSKVEVVWLDAMTKVHDDLDETGDLSNYQAGCINNDIGRWMGIKDNCVVIALELCNKTQHYPSGYRGTTDIPLGMVEGIYKLGRVATVWEKSKENQSTLITKDSTGISSSSKRKSQRTQKRSTAKSSSTQTAVSKGRKAR
jgi:hypothetical protein